MRQQDVFKKIGIILNELNEQYEYLKTQADNLNDLELELFAANANFLTDHLEILRKLNAHITKSLPPHETFALPATPPATQLWNQPETAEPANEPEAIQIPVETVPEPEPVAETQPEPVAEIQEEEPVNEVFFDFTTPRAEEPQAAYVEPVYPHDEEPSHEEHTEPAEAEETRQETDVRPILEQYQQHDQPAPSINIGSDAGSDDEFSYIRQPEPEVIRHELTLDEADTWPQEEEEEQVQATAPQYTEPETPVYTEPATSEPQQAAVEAHKPDNAQQEAIDFLRARNVSHTAFPPTEAERPLTLNERISAQLGHQHQESAAQPIKDLKSAINLNDKMLFVRDLFNGYSLAYSEAIEILNRFNNFDEANRFLANNYVAKNNWESKPDTADKFYDLLRRRFASA